MRKNKTSLVTLLMKVKDKRKAGGKRHQLIHILVITLIGTMSGYEGYRGIDAFVQRFESQLICLLRIKRKEVPSMATIRRVLMSVDFNQVSWAFYQWAKTKVPIKKKEWLCCDGKGLKGSVKNSQNKQQCFINIVSLYCSRAGVALYAKVLNNKKRSEIDIMRELLETLDISDVTITMDAMHCQKKLYALL